MKKRARDPEFEALATVYNTLARLDWATATRVLDWVSERLAADHRAFEAAAAVPPPPEPTA